jgi:hypothetical protein
MTCDTRQDLAACFTWKQVGLRFSSLASRLMEARARMVHVASSWRLHRVEAEDGWVDATDHVRPCYPYFVVFIVLDHRGILVF